MRRTASVGVNTFKHAVVEHNDTVDLSVVEVTDDVVEGDDGSRRHREVLGDLGECRPVASAAFLPIGGDDEADDVDVGMGLQDRHRLADRRSCGGDILDDEYPIAVGRQRTDKNTALAMVFGLFAIEQVADVASTSSQADRGGGDERDALVGGTKEDVDIVGHDSSIAAA